MKRLIRKKWIAGLAVLGFWGCLFGPAFAEIYKWKDSSGKTHYTNDISKIPRGAIRSDDVKTLHSVSPSSRGSSNGSPTSGSKSEAELTDADKAKIKTAMTFLEQEIQFNRDHQNDVATSTGLRQFLNAYNQLTQQRRSLLQQVEGTSVPALNAVADHLRSALKTAESDPIGMRRMSVAMGLDRVRAETAGNAGLIARLKEAIEESEKKQDKGAKDQKAKKAQSQITPAPKTSTPSKSATSGSY